MARFTVNTNNECGKDYKEILNNIKQAGFDSVMVAFKLGNGEEVIKEALSLGLEIPCVHLSSSDSIWAEGETNDEFIVQIKEELELCKKYNIHLATIHPTSGMPNLLALGTNEQGLKTMKTILTYAKKCKVKLALENLTKSNFKRFKFLLDNIVDKNLGLCYDAGHHQLYNPEFNILKKYGDRILTIHLHDNLMDWHYGHDWSRDLHRIPFDGKINYEKIIKDISKTPYNGSVLLEIHKGFDGGRKYAKMSNLEFLIKAKKTAEKIEEMFNDYRKTNK